MNKWLLACLNYISCHRLGYGSTDYKVKHSGFEQFSHHAFFFFSTWAKSLQFWSWACLGLELMGLGISTDWIYSHLNESSFVPFQAATSAGAGLKCSTCQCRNSLICFASGLWLLFDYICVLWGSTKHISFCPWVWALFGNLCRSDLGNFRTYVCLLLWAVIKSLSQRKFLAIILYCIKLWVTARPVWSDSLKIHV